MRLDDPLDDAAARHGAGRGAPLRGSAAAAREGGARAGAAVRRLALPRPLPAGARTCRRGGRLLAARARHRRPSRARRARPTSGAASLHYQLATALRATGATAEAEREFAEAQRLSVEQAASRARAARAVSGRRAGRRRQPRARACRLKSAGFEHLRRARARRTRGASATRRWRATYLNLGIIHAQAAASPAPPSSSSGGAESIRRFRRCSIRSASRTSTRSSTRRRLPALARALEQQPQNADSRRMLALASLNADDYAQGRRAAARRSEAARPIRRCSITTASRCVRSDRADEAEKIFSRVLARASRRARAERRPRPDPRRAGRLRAGDRVAAPRASSSKPTSPRRTRRSATSTCARESSAPRPRRCAPSWPRILTTCRRATRWRRCSISTAERRGAERAARSSSRPGRTTPTRAICSARFSSREAPPPKRSSTSRSPSRLAPDDAEHPLSARAGVSASWDGPSWPRRRSKRSSG